MVKVTRFLHITVQYPRILVKVTIMMGMMMMMMAISNGINESFAVEAGPVQPRFNTLLLIRIIIIGIPSNQIPPNLIQSNPIQPNAVQYNNVTFLPIFLSLELWGIPLYPKKCIDQYESVFVMKVGLLIIINNLNWALKSLKKGSFRNFLLCSRGNIIRRRSSAINCMHGIVMLYHFHSILFLFTPLHSRP